VHLLSFASEGRLVQTQSPDFTQTQFQQLLKHFTACVAASSAFMVQMASAFDPTVLFSTSFTSRFDPSWESFPNQMQPFTAILKKKKKKKKI
jgi:hypothetical protein